MLLTLMEKKVEVPGVETFIFEPAEPLAWRPGQFLHYVLHHEPTDDRGSDRWFTVASAPFESHIQITTRITTEKSSSFKKTLVALKAGDHIEITHVDGDFTLDDLDAEHIFIAGGIGVTPFRSILLDLDRAGAKPKVKLLYSNRDEHIPFKALFEELAQRNPNLEIHYLTGRLDEAKIRELVPDLATPVFYVSGPEPMVDAFRPLLEGMGVPTDHIKQDWFPGYPLD